MLISRVAQIVMAAAAALIGCGPAAAAPTVDAGRQGERAVAEAVHELNHVNREMKLRDVENLLVDRR